MSALKTADKHAAQVPKGVEPQVPLDLAWHLLPPHIPRALKHLSAERDAAEIEIVSRHESRQSAADSEYQSQMSAAAAQRDRETKQTQSAAEQAIGSAASRLEADTNTIQDRQKRARQTLLADVKKRHEKARGRAESDRWEAVALYEASTRGEKQRVEQFRAAIDAEAQHIEQLKHDADLRLSRVGHIFKAQPTAAAEADTPPDPLEALRAAVQSAEESLVAVERMRSPQFVSGPAAIWLFLIPFGLLAILGAIYLGPRTGLIAAGAGAVVVALALSALLWQVAKRTLSARVPNLLNALSDAERLLLQTRAWNNESHERRVREIETLRHDQITKADVMLGDSVEGLERERTEGLQQIDRQATDALAKARTEAERQRNEAETNRAQRLAATESNYSSVTTEATSERDRRRAEARNRRDRDWTAMVERWRSGIRGVQTATNSVASECGARFVDWHAAPESWKEPAEVPPAVRFGALDIDLARIPHGSPRDAQLRAETPAHFPLPALLTFPDRASLLLRATGQGRIAGIRVLQGAMLRFLTGLPPGKVRFTIIDPTGLGKNFAAFMHLADYSELLVTSRIWTEPQQIEQRLADLSLHMENVIQQFLRNEFATLEEYNRQAAEVAEPYRVLVVANFPANFNEASAQRLLSIIQGGARCGVHVLMLVDEDQPLPATVKLDDFQSHATTLIWEGDHFAWRDPDFAPFALALDEPPRDDVLTKLMQRVGRAAQAASRVEVPFEVITPARDAWWTASTRHGIDVPLGRAGATKLQSLRLGQGTSQHVLIAGRTGSGKSTLLHALITNAALIYSPDEVEFYLIDFKKGVEFRTYAEYELPHARVIAIESEREFGLSVLHRLDEELKQRGEAFRAAGVHDLAGYRAAPGTTPLPRVLLIVDEFQEFFVEDDKLAQDAALLLDRLVRQGRAFGVHIHLGSQTLGGAYSLARTTLGQMAVRIALQCSESDAHLILSEDNAAARLLSRPGEAIYNDANGLIEGNHVFQVVWLNEDRREHYLSCIRDLARKPGAPAPRSQIVFEGNIPSDIRKNPGLRALLDRPGWPETVRAPVAWMGEAVAIKDATAVTFRKQGGNNLLIIGQDAPAARGILSATVASLVAQFAPGRVRLIILDGTLEDDPDFASLEDVANALPHNIVVGRPRDATRWLEELGTELVARQDGSGGSEPTVLFLFDGSRFRDLRKADDDFGFGKREEKPTPAQHLSELLREGPSLGMHVVAWFDTLNNVNRVFDRAAMREFESRVLFQMSANDSSTLIDSPLANRLGTHRALFSSEEQGALEKFRPFALPDAAWLREVATKLSLRKMP